MLTSQNKMFKLILDNNMTVGNLGILWLNFCFRFSVTNVTSILTHDGKHRPVFSHVLDSGFSSQHILLAQWE